MNETITIKNGDTLTGIALKNNTTVSALLAANKYITDPNKIIAGKTLVVPKAATAPTSTIQTTTTQRTTDQENLNKFNQASALKTGAVTTGVQTTGNVDNGTASNVSVDGKTTTTTPAGITAESLYLSGVTDPTEIYNQLVAGNQAKDVTIDTVKNTVTNLAKDPNSLLQSQTNMQLKRLDQERDNLAAQFETMKQGLEAENKAAIDSITATFTRRRDQLKTANESLIGTRAKAGYATDAFRYTPQQMEGLVTNDENNYIMKLTELDAEEKSLLMQAATAKRKGDWELLGTMMSNYDKINDNRTNLLSKLITVAQNNNKKIDAEAKIAAKANAVPSATQGAALGKAVAPAIREAIDGMTDAEKEAFITEKATALKIDPLVLKGAVLNQSVTDTLNTAKITKAQQQAVPKSSTKKTTTTKVTADQAIGKAIDEFSQVMKQKGWKGVNPDHYQEWYDYVNKRFGYTAAKKLKKAMEENGLAVDNGQ